MGTLAELAQIRTVTARHQGQVREKAAHPGAEQPQMMAVDQVGVKFGCRLLQTPIEGRMVGIDLLGAKIDEAAAGVGHYITHAHHVEGQVRAAEMNETATSGRQFGNFGVVRTGNPGQEEVVMPAAGRRGDHGPDIYSAAGGFRSLAQDVKDAHGSILRHLSGSKKKI